MTISRFFRKDFFPYGIGLVIYTISILFPKYTIDIWLFSIILILSIGFYYISFKNRNRVILRVLSLYIFCNFILFPTIYLIILKNNSNSFQLDSTILSSEKYYSLNDIDDYYNPDILDKNLTALDSIVSDTSHILDTTVQFLNTGNILSIEHFIISKNCIPVSGAGRPMYKATMNICNKSGIQITFFKDKDEGCNIGKSSQTIREYLSFYRQKIGSQLKEFNVERSKIVDKNDVWTYKQLLPYSINIFSTSNIVPKSRLANVVFHLHQFLVATILISLLVSFFQNYISSKK